MRNRNSRQSEKQQTQFVNTMKNAAFWCAALCTFLLWPQLLAFSDWLNNAVFADQVDGDMLELMKWVLFFLVIMVTLSLSRLAWGSSAAVIAFWALSRLPIF